MKKTICSLICIIVFSQAYAQWFSWEARMGHTESDLQTMATEMDRKGFTPTHIHAHHINGQTRFSTIWKHYPSRNGWECRTNLSVQGLQEAADDLSSRGFVPVDNTVYNVDGSTRYTIVWSKEQVPYQTWTNIKAADFKSTIDDFTAQGYRLTDIDGYTENGERFFSAIWKKFSSAPWKYVFGYNLTDFRTSLADAQQEGYIPTNINVFEENGQPVFSAIYVKIDNEKSKVYYQVEENGLQQLVDNNVEDGYAITDVDSYVMNDQVFYSVVFTKAVQQTPVQQPVFSLTQPQHGSTISSPTSTGSRVLNIAPVEQQTTVWCWLAVGEMIFRHYGIPNANTMGNYQCGIIGSLNFVSPACATNCFNTSCIVPSGSNYNTVRMLRDYSWRIGNKIFSCAEGRELPFTTIKANIDAGKPILAGVSYHRRQYYGGAEHAVLITGYEYNASGIYLVVNDPFPYAAGNNPYLREGGRMVRSNQYKIPLRNFTEGVYWHWSLSDITIE